MGVASIRFLASTASIEATERGLKVIATVVTAAPLVVDVIKAIPLEESSASEDDKKSRV